MVYILECKETKNWEPQSTCFMALGIDRGAMLGSDCLPLLVLLTANIMSMVAILKITIEKHLG